ncbi:MAG: hypothetical protein Q7R49_00065 [Candidatus Daviesbacteria bacterium]|nr:hypothetical protein [Candidatus Daviesbacteria bacterium]
MINPLLTSKYEDEILDLIDNQDEYTRSDLQGIVTVLVNKIMNEGIKIISNQEGITKKR